MNSIGLMLFRKLCDVGNALELLRDMYAPASDQWVWHTELLGILDAAIDTLVDSTGIDDDGDDA